MSKATATVLVIAILFLVGVGVVAFTPAGRNLGYGGAYPGAPNTGGTGGTNVSVTAPTPTPRNPTTIFNNYFSTTTYRIEPSPIPTPSPAPTRHAVFYANSGFNPSVLVIARGDQVTFVNNSTTTIRIAGLPGFDFLHTVGSGDSFTQAFSSAGTYGYSNYYNPSQGGTVIVQ